MKVWEFICAKVLSARLVIAIAVTFTVCVTTYKSVMILLPTKPETAIAILGSLFLSFTVIVKDYFNRADRAQDPTIKPDTPKLEAKPEVK